MSASITNTTSAPVAVSWVSPTCEEINIGTLPSGVKHTQKAPLNAVVRAREKVGGPLLNEVVINRDGQNLNFKKIAPTVVDTKSDMVLPSDPTEYVGVKYKGMDSRTLYDRRSGYYTAKVYLVDATYLDGRTVEFQVNAEFGSAELATDLSAKYARMIGQLPRALRKELTQVMLHDGDYPSGGGTKTLILHRDAADRAERESMLEEYMIHELGHTSLDAVHANSAGWLAAQSKDKNFISDYARENPTREDIAESFQMWFAVRYRADRISKDYYDFVLKTIPARLNYFDTQNFSVSPVKAK